MLVRYSSLLTILLFVNVSAAASFRSAPLETIKKVIERTDPQLLTPEGSSFSICGSHGALLRVFAGPSKVHPRVYAIEKKMDARSFSNELVTLLEPIEKSKGQRTLDSLHRFLVGQIDRAFAVTGLWLLREVSGTGYF